MILFFSFILNNMKNEIPRTRNLFTELSFFFPFFLKDNNQIIELVLLSAE